MRTVEVARLIGMTGDLSRMAMRAGIAEPLGTGCQRTWSAGDALALWILRELDGNVRFAEGARKAGEALDANYPPARRDDADDDTARIQEAFSLAAGGPVELPPGTYIVGNVVIPRAVAG